MKRALLFAWHAVGVAFCALACVAMLALIFIGYLPPLRF